MSQRNALQWEYGSRTPLHRGSRGTQCCTGGNWEYVVRRQLAPGQSWTLVTTASGIDWITGDNYTRASALRQLGCGDRAGNYIDGWKSSATRRVAMPSGHAPAPPPGWQEMFARQQQQLQEMTERLAAHEAALQTPAQYAPQTHTVQQAPLDPSHPEITEYSDLAVKEQGRLMALG